MSSETQTATRLLQLVRGSRDALVPTIAGVGSWQRKTSACVSLFVAGGTVAGESVRMYCRMEAISIDACCFFDAVELQSIRSTACCFGAPEAQRCCFGASDQRTLRPSIPKRESHVCVRLYASEAVLCVWAKTK